MNNRLGILTAIVAALGSVSTGAQASDGETWPGAIREAIGGKDRPWRNRDSMFYGMTGKAYRRLERKLRGALKCTQK